MEGESITRRRTYVEVVRAEGLPVEEQVSIGLDAMQGQVDRDQDELALDVLVRHGAAVALRVRSSHACISKGDMGRGAQQAQQCSSSSSSTYDTRIRVSG